MDPRKIQIKDYTYELPDERIAYFPLKERDASRLLIYKDGAIKEDQYKNLADHLPAFSLVIFNNTRVLEARIIFQKPTGGQIEIFCLEPHEQYADMTTAMQQSGEVQWYCLIGGASKWKHGQVLQKHLNYQGKKLILEARYLGKINDQFLIALSWPGNEICFAEVLHLAGAIPLPPYIKRQVATEDLERYQTIYSRYEGSVAAPTAGLHFTERVMEGLDKKNIQKEFVTLHVGAGTFKPVKSDTLEGHEMHAEYFKVSVELLQALLKHQEQDIFAVGTTSLRTLESLYWMGVKTKQNPHASLTDLALQQWDYLELEQLGITVSEAIISLIDWLQQREMPSLWTKTQLLITPGYRIRMVSGLITNFHQPQSTLLLLVAAMAGDDWKKIYQHALDNNFRFLSYGDGCLIWLRPQP